MRVVISGTHGTGKSTLLADFASSRSGWETLPDPYEYLDGAEAAPGAEVFAWQLRLAAARLLDAHAGNLIAERGSLDFLAYLQAIEELGRGETPPALWEEGWALTQRAMLAVDLLVLLPLSAAAGIRIGADEGPELQQAMDVSLLELAEDPDLTGAHALLRSRVLGSGRSRYLRTRSASPSLAGRRRWGDTVNMCHSLRFATSSSSPLPQASGSGRRGLRNKTPTTRLASSPSGQKPGGFARRGSPLRSLGRSSPSGGAMMTG